MKTTNYILLIVLILSLFSCGPKAEEAPYESTEEATTEEVAPVSEVSSEESSIREEYVTKEEKQHKAEGYISSSAAVENKDSKRKFVRTAELKFKVKDVIESTYRIEAITIKQGGFVTYTNLTSTINSTETNKISRDSLLETTRYTVINNMTIRVPNTELDTTLKLISREIDYLDYRIIKAEDVSLDILSNELKQKRTEETNERITKAIDNRGKKLDESIRGEELLSDKKAESDEAMISNLKIEDKINYSTIEINLYQRESIKNEILSENKQIEYYEPNIFIKIKESLIIGWEIIEEIIVFLFKIWSLLLLGLIGFLIYIKFIKDKK